MRLIHYITYAYLATFFLSACGSESQDPQKIATESESAMITITADQFAASDFAIGGATVQPVPKIINAAATVEIPSSDQATVTTLLPGIVQGLTVQEGSYVRKDAKLFTIINPELIDMQEDLLVHQSQIRYLQAEVQRTAELVADNLVTKKETNLLKSHLRSEEAQAESLIKKLQLYGISTDNLTTSNLISQLVVRAPIDGVISNLDIRNGSYLEGGMSATSLYALDRPYLKISVLDTDIDQVKRGQEVMVAFAGSSEKWHQAIIDEIMTVPSAPGVVIAKAKLTKNGDLPRPGTYGQASIHISVDSLTTLPKTAVNRSGDKMMALRLVSKDNDQYTFELVHVEIIQELEDSYAIRGLGSLTSEFLTEGAYHLTQ